MIVAGICKVIGVYALVGLVVSEVVGIIVVAPVTVALVIDGVSIGTMSDLDV